MEYIGSPSGYKGRDVESLQNSFQKAIDNYLKLTHNWNIESEQLLKGTFNITIGSIIHCQPAIIGKQKG